MTSAHGLYVKPALPEVAKAVMEIAAVVPFFPQDEFALELITEELYSFIGTREQLDWFKRIARGSLSKYDGVPQLRALFCTKFAPADGRAPIVECPGFEESALEAAFHKRVMEENDRRLEHYKREAAIAPPEDRAPLELELPEVKMLPPAPAVPGADQFSAGEQLASVEAAIRCPWCAEGLARVRSSVSSNFIHPDVPYAGRVVCKNRDPLPTDVGLSVDMLKRGYA